ncbi:MAG: TetR/AcrR family transcriptional regulator [Ancrocorticia sp.]|uniref:TetR/AcrR family transcriptional regulator n=1 Tax=Ancrocorticia sp. TaxID=2593684 RepID=UPI003F9194D3
MPAHTRQVRRTRERLVTALAGLLVDVPYETITLSQIAVAAGVARPSIYRHFNDKNAILAEYFVDIFSEFEVNVRSHNGTAAALGEPDEWTYRALFRTLFAHADELRNFSRPETRALLLDGIWSYQSRLIEYATEAARDLNGASGGSGANSANGSGAADNTGGGRGSADTSRATLEEQSQPLLQQVATINYQSGGGAALVTEWVQQGMTIPPDDMAALLMGSQRAFRDQDVYLPDVLAGHFQHGG